jgi:hypothetical protein
MRFLTKVEAALDWPADVILRHFERRQFELAMAVTMIGVGLLLFFSPQSFQATAVSLVSASTCSTLFFIWGICRIVALALNGNWMPGGAYMRACGAAVGAVVWSQWATALHQLHRTTAEPISPDVVVYGILAFFEVVSFSRSLRGAMSCGQANRQDVGNYRKLATGPLAIPNFLPRGGNPSVAPHHKAVPVSKA